MSGRGFSQPALVVHSFLLTHSHSVNKRGEIPPGSGASRPAAMRGHSALLDTIPPYPLDPTSPQQRHLRV